MSEPTTQQPTTPRRRRWRRWLWLLVASPVAFLGIVNLLPPPRVEIAICPEITVITEPLRPDGTPDYVAYLNRLHREGMDLQDNAVPLLLQAVGLSGHDTASFDPTKSWDHFELATLQALEVKLQDARGAYGSFLDAMRDEGGDCEWPQPITEP